MNRLLLRATGHILALGALLICLIFPASRYEWMSEFDREIDTSTLIDRSDNASIFIGITAALAILLEFFILARSRKRGERIMPALLMLSIITACIIRYVA
jgi:hypothetical protein